MADEEVSLRSSRPVPILSFARERRAPSWQFPSYLVVWTLGALCTIGLFAIWLVARLAGDPAADWLTFPLGIGIVFAGAAFRGLVRATRTDTLVSFFGTTIEVREQCEGPPISVIGWDRLESFDDSAPDRVVLHAAGSRSIVLVPTTDDAKRAALIDLLEERGVKRG